MAEQVPNHPQYHATLIDFMSFVDGVQHHKDTSFTPQRLGQIRPPQLVRWMCLKVYGTPTPGPADRPTVRRSSSLEYYKKAISNYMPNKLMPWNALAQEGNPTRSVEVNNFIKAVKKKEVRKQGKASSARRPLEKSEFVDIQRYFRSRQDPHRRFRLPAFTKFQYNLIARNDDTANFETADLKAVPEFPFALQCRMCWSKNITEERDAPDQILLGAMDPDFCVLLGLGVYMENWMEHGNGINSRFLFSEDVDDATPNRIKNNIQTIIREAVNSPDFHRAKPGPLGTHSNQKFPSTFAHRNGCARDEVDCRGCWQNKKRTVDRYIDVVLQYTDAKVAAAL